VEWFFDEELTRLRWAWVSAVRTRVSGGSRLAALSAEQVEAERRAHSVATAYFERIGELQAA
jgi:hypothetical protein